MIFRKSSILLPGFEITPKLVQKAPQEGPRGALGRSLDPPGDPAGGARATPGSVPRLPGLLGAAPGEPRDHFGMQNAAKNDEIRT